MTPLRRRTRLDRLRRRAGGWLLLRERQQIGAPEPTLPLTAHPQTGQATGIRPASQRGLADPQELSGLLDVQEVLDMVHHSIASPGTRLGGNKRGRPLLTQR